MHALDLSHEPPRRWNAAIDEIIWLPRLIDKARAAAAGTLGSYLYGQSPMDRMLLRELGLGYRAFFEIVTAAPDDAAVIAAIGARDAQALDRARAWSRTAPARYRLWYLGVDIDDGYVGASWLRPAVNTVINPLMWIVKRIWPSRATGTTR